MYSHCSQATMPSVATTPNPYQGLKLAKVLSEITSDNSVATTPNPYQGLKLAGLNTLTANTTPLQQHQIPIRD